MISFLLTLVILIASYFLCGRLVERLFGASLLLMAVGITGGILVKGYAIPETTLSNLPPSHLLIPGGCRNGHHGIDAVFICR